MSKKLLSFREYLNDELKDGKFKKLYEEEGKKSKIGYKIAQLRQKLGLTQKQLAERIETSQTVIARLEGGDYWKCSLQTLEKIALATGTKLTINFKQ